MASSGKCGMGRNLRPRKDMESNSGLTTCPSAPGWGRGRGRGRGRGGTPGRGAMRGHNPRDPQREDAVGLAPQERRGNLHENEEVLEPTVSSIVTSLSETKISAYEPELDFPFLKDSNTISYLRSSQTMFIMRGVSGSGKSTIARALKNLYPSAVLCSADDYFMTGGEYKFRSDDLGSAHRYCQEKAEEAVRNQVNVIIIDNTNVKRWEMKFYMDLARHNFYHLVIVQPKTAWRDDPKVLSSRNTHNVDEVTIRKKIKEFEDYVPFYYAWFLNKEDSLMVYKKCYKCLVECIESIPGFSYDVLGQDCRAEEFLEYFKLKEVPNSIYHCTSKFLGGWKSKIEGRLEYHQNADVQRACGQSFRISMTGLIVTSTVVAVRIKLTSKESLDLYDKPEENADGRLPGNFRHLKGSSAHLTIATAEGIPPKQSNSELLTIVALETNNTKQKASHGISCGVVDIWGRNYCSIILNSPLEINTLFSGF